PRRRQVVGHDRDDRNHRRRCADCGRRGPAREGLLDRSAWGRKERLAARGHTRRPPDAKELLEDTMLHLDWDVKNPRSRRRLQQAAPLLMALAGLFGCTSMLDLGSYEVTGLERCGSVLADLSSDTGNCGTCGSVCPMGAACVSGRCACP